MITRYEVRNNCYRMKKGVAPRDPEIIAEIDSLRDGRSWVDFDDTWDVVVKKEKIIVIPSIKDLNLVSETCAKKNLTVEIGVEKEWSVQEDAVIQMIEAQFLEGIMTWSNYREKWNVRWNFDQNRVETYIVNRPSIQTEVTQEMIDAKLRESMKSIPKSTTSLEVRPMTEEEKDKFTKMLADGKI